MPTKTKPKKANGNGGARKSDTLELTPDLIAMLKALGRHHILRPREFHQLNCIAEKHHDAAMHRLIAMDLIRIRFVELTPAGKSFVEGS